MSWRDGLDWMAVGLAIAVAGCGSRKLLGEPADPAGSAAPAEQTPPEKVAKAPADAGPATDAAPPALRAVHLAVIIEAGEEPGESAISLAMTDETGAVKNVPVGVFSGRCVQVPAIAGPGLGDAEPVLAIDCASEEGGARIRLVRKDDELIVLRAWVRGESTPAYNVVGRIPLPEGATITTG